jgi:hypothetical protein
MCLTKPDYSLYSYTVSLNIGSLHMLSRSESSAILTLCLTGRSADGDLLACNDIGREGDSMLSLTLIFSNLH